MFFQILFATECSLTNIIQLTFECTLKTVIMHRRLNDDMSSLDYLSNKACGKKSWFAIQIKFPKGLLHVGEALKLLARTTYAVECG